MVQTCSENPGIGGGEAEEAIKGEVSKTKATSTQEEITMATDEDVEVHPGWTAVRGGGT